MTKYFDNETDKQPNQVQEALNQVLLTIKNSENTNKKFKCVSIKTKRVSLTINLKI